MSKWFNEIEMHPFIIALVVFGLLFIVYNVFKKGTPTASLTTAGTGATTPGGGDTYAQQFTSYPTYTGPVVNQNQPPPPVPTPVVNTPGHIYPGPTGVNHYLTTGSETLSQIAAKLGTGGWNSIYAIPNNQIWLGKMNAATAASFKPSAGLYITVPGNAKAV